MVPLFMERICSIMVCYIGRMTYCYNKATGNREKGTGYEPRGRVQAEVPSGEGLLP